MLNWGFIIKIMPFYLQGHCWQLHALETSLPEGCLLVLKHVI
jgi:hypothetical protein